MSRQNDSLLGTFGTLFSLMANRDSYESNMNLLAGFTLIVSFLVGYSCAVYAASGLSFWGWGDPLSPSMLLRPLLCRCVCPRRTFSYLAGRSLRASLVSLVVVSSTWNKRYWKQIASPRLPNVLGRESYFQSIHSRRKTNSGACDIFSTKTLATLFPWRNWLYHPKRAGAGLSSVADAK